MGLIYHQGFPKINREQHNQSLMTPAYQIKIVNAGDYLVIHTALIPHLQEIELSIEKLCENRIYDVVESFLLTADISLQGVHKVITDEFETRIEIAASADDFRKATLKKEDPALCGLVRFPKIPAFKSFNPDFGSNAAYDNIMEYIKGLKKTQVKEE